MTRQRHRLYDAEDEIANETGWYSSLAGAQFEVDRLIRGKWWRDRSPVVRVDLVYPERESGAERITDTHWRIDYSPRALCGINVAHELTHVLMGATAGARLDDHDQDHSAHFAGAELEVVKRLIGRDTAQELRRQFDAFDVKYVVLPNTPPANLDTPSGDVVE